MQVTQQAGPISETNTTLNSAEIEIALWRMQQVNKGHTKETKLTHDIAKLTNLESGKTEISLEQLSKIDQRFKQRINIPENFALIDAQYSEQPGLSTKISLIFYNKDSGQGIGVVSSAGNVSVSTKTWQITPQSIANDLYLSRRAAQFITGIDSTDEIVTDRVELSNAVIWKLKQSADSEQKEAFFFRETGLNYFLSELGPQIDRPAGAEFTGSFFEHVQTESLRVLDNFYKKDTVGEFVVSPRQRRTTERQLADALNIPPHLFAVKLNSAADGSAWRTVGGQRCLVGTIRPLQLHPLKSSLHFSFNVNTGEFRLNDGPPISRKEVHAELKKLAKLEKGW